MSALACSLASSPFRQPQKPFSPPPSQTLSKPTHNHKQVEVIVGFRNTGPTPANVSFIVGSLNSAADFSMHFQNFSALRPAGPVVQLPANGGDAAVSYRFQLAPNLPEYAFQVALTAFLDVDGETIGEGSNRITIPKMNAHTFFNRTVDVVEPARLVDWQLLQMVATLLGFGAAVGGVGLQMARAGGGSGEGGGDFSKKKKMGSGSSGKKASTAASVSASSASSSKPAAASDWLKGTNIGGAGKSKKKA